jgi:hypothetical protein
MTLAWSTRRSMVAPIGSTMRPAGPFFQPSAAIVTVPEGAARTTGALDELPDPVPWPATRAAHPLQSTTKQATPMTAFRTLTIV